MLGVGMCAVMKKKDYTSTDILAMFDEIAAEMDRVHAVPGAKIGYDLFADGLVWSDEYPADIGRRADKFNCIRCLLRFRTSILTGTPDERCRQYWDRAIELFPNWAGFTPSRLEPSDELTKLYEIYGAHETRPYEELHGEDSWRT